MYRLALAHFDIYEIDGKQTARVELPNNDVAPTDYCFYDVISETDSVAALTDHVSRLGFTEDETDYGDINCRDHGVKITAVVPIVETTERWSREQKQALVWVKIPRTESLGLDVQEKIAPLTDEQWEEFNVCGCDYLLGVSRYGDDGDGKAAVIIEGWEFYHLAPLYGFTWQSVLNQFGVEGDKPEPFGFSDDSDACSECGVIDNMDNGYTYNFRETPSGNYAGVNCGCYDALCAEEFLDNANKADKCINRDIAEKLAEDGKLEFVCDATHRSFTSDTITPEHVLTQLLAENADAQYIMAMDDCGQFHTDFSVWKVIEE